MQINCGSRTFCQSKKAMEWLHIIVVIHLAIFASSFPQQTSFRSRNAEHLLSDNINNNDPNSDLCFTPGCVETAAEVLSNLDENVDPCQNFYRFACGGWMNRHSIPGDRSIVSASSEAADDLKLKLRALLEKNLDGTEASFIKMLKDFYDSCMDLQNIDREGSEPLKKVLKKFGGWPVVEGSKWDESNFDWLEVLIAFRKTGYDHTTLLTVSVDADARKNTVNTIYLDQASLGMPDRTYLVRGLSDSSTAAYYEMMVKSAKLLGADEVTAKKELLKAVHFEMALANISLPSEERRDFNKLYHKYTVKQLQEEIPQIPWLKYFNGLLNDEIYENETLIIRVPEFVKSFADLLIKTDKRVVANYMLWRVVDDSLSVLSKEWRDIAHEYNSVSTGEREEKPRWEQCLSSVSESLEIAISSYYVRHYFKEESKDAALEMVKYLHKEFLHILDETDWMDEQTKKEAKAKALAIKPYIGYPDELLNDTAVAELYENLTVTPENYFENELRIQKWLIGNMFSDLRKPNIKGEWKEHALAAVINAFYSPFENSIAFPAAVLQNPYFNKDRPNYMNFGGIGYVIGHEITHGFDDTGRQFDKDGNNLNWWGKTTDELFRKKAQCIIDQYSNYTVENGMKLNGVNTQDENIADNGGLKEAYRAYHSWVTENGQEQLLPGVKYSQNQLFWISAANVWCAKYRPEALDFVIITDTHSPAEFRVIGPMSNLNEFAEDFNCPPDSPMIRKQKCQVW